MSEKGLINKLEQIAIKYDEISKQMVDPDVINDMKRYVSLNKEYNTKLCPNVDSGIVV